MGLGAAKLGGLGRGSLEVCVGKGFLQWVENEGGTPFFPVKQGGDSGEACSSSWDGNRQSHPMPQDCWKWRRKTQFIAIYELKKKVYFKGIQAILNIWLLLAFSNALIHCLPVSLSYKPSVLFLK